MIPLQSSRLCLCDPAASGTRRLRMFHCAPIYTKNERGVGDIWSQPIAGGTEADYAFQQRRDY